MAKNKKIKPKDPNNMSELTQLRMMLSQEIIIAKRKVREVEQSLDVLTQIYATTVKKLEDKMKPKDEKKTDKKSEKKEEKTD